MVQIHIAEVVGFFDSHVFAQQIGLLLVYALVAKLSDLLIDRGLRRLASLTKASFDDNLIDCIHKPIYWTVFCMGILHVLLLTNLQPPWQSAFPSLVKSIILFFWLMAVSDILSQLARKELFDIVARRQVSNDVFIMLTKISRVIIFIIGLLWGLAIWHVNLTPLFASAGIAGIAVALAVKDTLANLFGGISMFMDKTFKVGDYIILDNIERGEVVDIGMRSTRIKTRDDVLITVPNSILATSKIVNESAPEPRFRIRIPVGVAYGSDIEKVEEVLLRIASENEGVSPEPAPRVRFRAFGSSSLDFQLLCWVNEPSFKGRITHEILKKIYHGFAEENIEIPFPQLDLHMKK